MLCKVFWNWLKNDENKKEKTHNIIYFPDLSWSELIKLTTFQEICVRVSLWWNLFVLLQKSLAMKWNEIDFLCFSIEIHRNLPNGDISAICYNQCDFYAVSIFVLWKDLKEFCFRATTWILYMDLQHSISKRWCKQIQFQRIHIIFLSFCFSFLIFICIGLSL